MTNGDRIRAMDNEELEGEMWRFATCEYVKHINLPAWLASEDKEYPICGRDAVVELQNGERYTCVVVGTRPVFDQQYQELVVTGNFPYSSRLLSVPKKCVSFK